MLKRSWRAAVALGAALFVHVAGAAAGTEWADWSGLTPGAPGAASGTLAGLAVDYSGQLLVPQSVVDGSTTHWSPDSSYVGGTVTVSPSSVGDVIALDGSLGVPSTLTFSAPVANPVVAFWSLGSAASPASFAFAGATPTFEVGGPNSEYGGGAITVVGNTVSGIEGNGVVMFAGIYSSLSWTCTREHYFAFTVGAEVCTTRATAVAQALCEGQGVMLDGTGSSFGCTQLGTPSYRWLEGTSVICQGSSPSCAVPPGTLAAGLHLLTLETSCAGDSSPCVSEAQVLVEVGPNVTPAALGNVVRGYRDQTTARFSWASFGALSAYRVYMDAAKGVPAASRQLLVQVTSSSTTASHEDALVSPPFPINYYQVVGLSCMGDIEGPY